MCNEHLCAWFFAYIRHILRLFNALQKLGNFKNTTRVENVLFVECYNYGFFAVPDTFHRARLESQTRPTNETPDYLYAQNGHPNIRLCFVLLVRLASLTFKGVEIQSWQVKSHTVFALRPSGQAGGPVGGILRSPWRVHGESVAGLWRVHEAPWRASWRVHGDS